EIAGKALLTVGRAIGEGDRSAVLPRVAGPEALVETLETAMLVVTPVIAAQLVGRPIQDEASARDAVAVAPADGAEIAQRGEVATEIGLAQHDIRGLAVAVRRAKLEQSRAQFHDAGREAMAVGDGEGADRGPLDAADD